MVLNYPSNPTGTSYTADELNAFAEIARKYRVILLSDEIYGKLHHEGRHVSVVPLYPEGTIFSGGLSKWCPAGGWRLGIFVFPSCLRWLLDAMAVVASETFTSTSAPIQYAAVRAFQANGALDQYIFQVRRILGSLGKTLAMMSASAGVNIQSPQGGFYLFPDFIAQADRLKALGINTSVDLCERLLNETGVAILPGYDFGRPLEELTARLAYVNFNGKKALEAAGHISADTPLEEEFLREHCREPMIAVERLCEWINA